MENEKPPALTAHPGVHEAVAAASGEGADRRLVAYVVAEGEARPFELRRSIEEKLPDFMVPSAFVFLDELPLTPNGKIDRKALPEPEGTRPELEKPFAAPGTPTEEILAGIWTEVLQYSYARVVAVPCRRSSLCLPLQPGLRQEL